MYFPFLTCEVKCGGAAFDVADRQNAHSMRGIVELFRLVKRAFSIPHDHSSMRIYGHYSLVDGDKTTFYRHPILNSILRQWKTGRSGRHTISRPSTTYGCRLTWKESVQLSIRYRPIWILRSHSNLSQGNPDFHKG